MEQFEKIKRALPEEKVEKKELPELEVTFCFGPHWSEKDTRFLKENLEKADIFSPEMCGYDPEDVESFNRLAQGDRSLLRECLSSSRENEDEWGKTICRLVFNSKKIILPIDITKGELFKNFIAVIRRGERALYQFALGKLREAIETRRTFIEEISDLQKKREEIILENLEKLPEKVCARHPELREKKKLKVLVFLGAFHTFVYHAMKKKGRSVKAIWTMKPYIFSRFAEVSRRERFLGESHFDDEFLAKSFLEDFLIFYFDKFSSDTAENHLAARIIASQVNFDLIKELSAEFKTRFMDTLGQLAQYTAHYLRKHKIEVPKNKGGLDKLIKNYLKK